METSDQASDHSEQDGRLIKWTCDEETVLDLCIKTPRLVFYARGLPRLKMGTLATKEYRLQQTGVPVCVILGVQFRDHNIQTE